MIVSGTCETVRVGSSCTTQGKRWCRFCRDAASLGSATQDAGALEARPPTVLSADRWEYQLHFLPTVPDLKVQTH